MPPDVAESFNLDRCTVSTDFKAKNTELVYERRVSRRHQRATCAYQPAKVKRAHLLQILHLVDHESVIGQQGVSPYHLEVREQAAEAFQPVHAVQEDVAGDLAQLGELYVLEIGLGSVLDQHHLQVALYHAAALHDLEILHAVPYVDALADSVADRHVLQPPRPGHDLRARLW